MQEAHCLLCSKYSLCCSVQEGTRSTPLDLGLGTPSPPDLGPGTPLPGPGMGYPLPRPEMGYPPPRPEMGYPLPRPEMGYPPPRKCGQTENITSRHPSDAGGNYLTDAYCKTSVRNFWNRAGCKIKLKQMLHPTCVQNPDTVVVLSQNKRWTLQWSVTTKKVFPPSCWLLFLIKVTQHTVWGFFALFNQIKCTNRSY